MGVDPDPAQEYIYIVWSESVHSACYILVTLLYYISQRAGEMLLAVAMLFVKIRFTVRGSIVGCSGVPGAG